MTIHLQEGMPAPAFNALDGEGQNHQLSDYQGRRLLLFFYPRDSTPG
jgi:thioredoxin-dependent peroxiredoxin